jgi:hypothetical protein
MKKPFLLFICCLSLNIFSTLNATPYKVIITRHGDKVPGGFCLSLQGLERASSFVHYFSGLDTFQAPPITHIFAAYIGGATPYIRPKQTCQPLADYLKIPLNLDYTPTQFTEVAKEVLTNPKYDNSSVLLCWEHDNIPNLIKALGADNPGVWDDDIFDQVYLLTYKNGKKPQVQKILQQLMYGDRPTIDATPTPLPQIAVSCPKDF